MPLQQLWLHSVERGNDFSKINLKGSEEKRPWHILRHGAPILSEKYRLSFPEANPAARVGIQLKA
jgi:hypothetical protein